MTVDRLPRPDLRLRDWKPGDPLSAAHWQEVVTALRRLHSGVSRPQQARPTVSPSAVSTPVKRLQVRSVEDDWLICRTHVGEYDAEGEDDFVRVAKPYLLQRTPFDGNDESGAPKTRNGLTFEYSNAYTRTVTDADDYTEEQVIVPSYQEGDFIYAVKSPQGGTGLSYTDEGSTVAVEFIDLNLDGRTWGAA